MISFCGVNAHFKNGIAEKIIRDLQESARKQLLHAKSRWPRAIELHLWPYALRLANHLRISLPDKEDATSPIERFSRVEVGPHLKENHPFGCPVFALNNRLQSGNRIPKWDTRARLGVYLGPSPQHASLVSLVLSLENGLVSPQSIHNPGDQTWSKCISHSPFPPSVVLKLHLFYTKKTHPLPCGANSSYQTKDIRVFPFR
jgi:hypothetical protein